MNIMAAFVVGSVLTAAISVTVVLLLRPHLMRLLTELCGSAARAGFWLVFSTLMILLVGLLAGTVDFGYNGSRPADQQIFFGIVTQLRSAILGLLLSLLVVSWLTMAFIRRFERGLIPPPPAPYYPPAPASAPAS